MPRATTKNELIIAACSQWEKLWSQIDSIPNGAHLAVFNFSTDPKLKEAHWARDKNLRDVLVHLHEWHQLLLAWTAANMNGGNEPFLPEPYNWKTYGGMNMEFWEKHQNTTYEDAVNMLRESHDKILELIDSLTDEELFEKKHFPWTGTTNIGSYCISATSSHYDWAMKKIKQYIKMNPA